MNLSTTAKVGIVTLIGLVLIGIVIVWKTDIFLVGSGYKLTCSFENIEGLTLGSEVRYRGLKVGKVMHIDPGPYDIQIIAQVDRSIKIPSDSTLRVSYDGIVGLKFLEIKPGTAESMYASTQVLDGVRTAAIVDFVDIAAKNLVETKAILVAVRKVIENPALQASFTNAVFAAEKLANELRAATQGIMKITTDPKFQAGVTGTVTETEKTLSSANRFFESMGKLNLRASGGLDLGTRANAVRGDVDVIQNEQNYLRFGIGEGPTRQLSVLDFLVSSKVPGNLGYRLGIINNQLGGGVVFHPSKLSNFMVDIYDINNPRPNLPKLRLGYDYELRDYMDMLMQADDVLNTGNSNFMLGIRVKPASEKLY